MMAKGRLGELLRGGSMLRRRPITSTAGGYPSTPMRRVRIGLVLALAVAVVGSAVSCSRSTEIEGTPVTTTEKAPRPTDPLESDALVTGSEAVAQLQALVNSMLATQDPCAVLTQRDIEANRLDPSLFTSAAARRVVTKGLIDVYDHLISISPAAITSALQAQKSVLLEVLAVVDQYANDPSGTKATKEINRLVSAPGYLAAQTQLTSWVSANCR